MIFGALETWTFDVRRQISDPGLRRPCSRGPGSSHDRWDKTRSTALRHSPNKLPWSHRVAPPGRQIEKVWCCATGIGFFEKVSADSDHWLAEVPQARLFMVTSPSLIEHHQNNDWFTGGLPSDARNWWRYHNFSTLVATPTLGSLGPVVAGLCPPWPSESAWGTARGSHVWWCTCPDEDRPELHYILALPTTKEMVNWGPQTGDNGKKRHEYWIPAKIYSKIFIEQIYACKYICFCHIWNPEWWIWDENGNKDGQINIINHHPSIHPTNHPST